jgi:tetratricopeptide (TPR) repeat protein
MKICPFTLIILVLLANFQLVRAGCDFNEDYLLNVNASIAASVKSDWDTALSITTKMIELDQQNPGYWFFRANVHSYRMTDEESFRWEEEFFRDIHKAEELLVKAETTNSQGLSFEFRFIKGSTLALKAYYLGRKGEWWQALKAGMRGISILRELNEDWPECIDIELGIGTFLYWKSARMKQFYWMPFIKDQRTDGMQMLEKVIKEGEFLPWVAISNLAWMLLDQNRPQEAANLLKPGLAQFPDSRLFLFPNAQARLQLQDYEAAEKAWMQLLESVRSDSYNNHVNEFICLEKLSGIAEKQADLSKSYQLSLMALELKISDIYESRIEKQRTRLLKRRNKTYNLEN